MGSHPNTILMVAITPHNLTRKTLAGILAEPNASTDSDYVRIGGLDYSHLVMEGDYDEGMQISGKEGSIIFHDFATYGHGEQITWTELESRKNALEEWAKGICERHQCDYEIRVGANYW